MALGVITHLVDDAGHKLPHATEQGFPLFQCLLSHLAVADVFDDSHEVLGLSLCISQHGHRQRGPQHTAIGLDIALLYSELGQLPFDQILRGLRAEIHIFRMCDVMKAQVQQLFA